MTPIRRSLFLLLLPGLGLRASAQASGQPAEISIRRSACFGRCPIYDFVLTDDNHMTFIRDMNSDWDKNGSGIYRAVLVHQ